MILLLGKNLLGNYEDAEGLLETALDLAKDSENESALMVIYNNLGIYYKERQKYKIACLEEIAWRNKWISRKTLELEITKNSSSSYGKYLYNIVQKEYPDYEIGRATNDEQHIIHFQAMKEMKGVK